MNALACSERGTNAQIDIAFEDFMSSGHMHNRAKAAMCSPDDLIVDYLPAFDVSDAAEVREAFGEACEQAVDGAIGKVRLDDEDLLFVRRHFIEGRHFRLDTAYPLDAA
ncbi:MAG: hypothetical protein HN742_26910 [Lentisphaerae bacterium]|jgi:hypothetical protein|nr:hypothetical protein [Lentisphaerota bacterium]MBT4820378.1 hypothetical protein [Lentisphaerota bacterium]MBT5606080.1 hypothetical protein [Lentisphaerota bacterium]MBT7057061.1 hypothetical protein [Lentisphaerota bacterium]MBT7845533.1 hypothetical protein [Lentisphaerota bacterium]